MKWAGYTGWAAAMSAALLALLLVASWPSAAEGSGPIRVADTEGSYDREVIAGDRETVGWVVFNLEENSSYAVVVSLRNRPESWNVTVSPDSFTLTPGRAQPVLLSFQSREGDAGEFRTLTIAFNSTEIVSDRTPRVFEETRVVSFTVSAAPSKEKHGMDIIFFSWKLGHIDLPGPMDSNWGRFVVSVVIWFIFAPLIIQLSLWAVSIVTSRTETKYDDMVLSIVKSPAVLIVSLYGVVDSLVQLEIPSALHSLLYKVVLLVAVAVVVLIIYRIFKRVFIGWLTERSRKTDTKLDDLLVPVIDKIGTVLIILGSALYILSILGLDVTVLVAGMGVAGLVVAFAAQDTLSNFFAGLLLLLDRPFETGDTIVLENGDYCEVRHIGLRSTRLYNIFLDDDVVIPNSRISSQQIVNASKPDRREKATLEVGVAYNSDVEKVERILLEVTRKHPDIVKDGPQAPLVRFSSFEDSCLKFKVFFTVDDFSKRWRVAHELRKEVLDRFRKEGVEIPYPQTVVHLRED
ncbi:MAG: mechanosensitive ion channel family protein [Thermoplasmatota archaeon]